MEKEEINILLLGFMAFKIFLIQFLRLVRYLYIYDKHELASKGTLTPMKLRRASPTPAIASFFGSTSLPTAASSTANNFPP
jgi:hypothetical protein